jgi:hypothetical protein
MTPELRGDMRVGPQLSEEERQKVQTEIDKLLAECRPILSNFEHESRKKAMNAFFLSMAGLMAGAVVGPALTAANAAANAGWIAAFSGFGGATNTASEALRSTGLSGTFAAQDRNRIIERLREELPKVFDDSKTVSDRMMAIIAAKVECALYEISVPTISTGGK